MPQKYLQRYAEAEARALLQHRLQNTWQQVLVVPAYRESANYSEEILRLAGLQQELLQILVLNSPDSVPGTDSEADPNLALRTAATAFPLALELPDCHASLHNTAQGGHLLLVERAEPLPAAEGVGLARKLGCDMALALIHAGRVQSEWIHSSDADATLPDGYFGACKQSGDAVAMTFPFHHTLPEDDQARLAMQRYEAKLEDHVKGLKRAGSPYAFQTLGSCLAVRASAYARVRGFPRRAAAEDFYLLNKLAKLGAVSDAGCDPIRLSPRLSDRVPFGTGPALQQLLAAGDPGDAALFYHPHCYQCLGEVLTTVSGIDSSEPGLCYFETELADRPEALSTLIALGLEEFLAHAARQCRDAAALQQQFHQWFDAFRTLKFIHGIRDRGWPNRA